MTGDLNATFEHRPIYTPRRFYVFMRRTTIPNSSFLIRAELSNVIMGRHARGANPRPSLRESPFSSTIEAIVRVIERRNHYAEF